MNEYVEIYQEVDFLVPAQRFNIQFSYISQRGLPFIREFVLRLIHVAPMDKNQIASYFGLSNLETEEAISDLVQRDELTLSKDDRLMLTEKAKGYFIALGETPQLYTIMDGGINLSFDLASFSSLGDDSASSGWRAGLPLRVEPSNQSNSEKLVEREFQRQFGRMLDKGLLKKSVIQNEKERPSVYTVSSVKKIRDFPLRLRTGFRITPDGDRIELEDYNEINNSEVVHQIITDEISRIARPNNLLAIFQAAMIFGDEDTLKVFDSSTNKISPKNMFDLNKLGENTGKKRLTFIGPIYLSNNWQILQKFLAPILAKRIENKIDVGDSRFTWIAPSNPFWGKSEQFLSCVSDFLIKSETKNKKLYNPTLYVPVRDRQDSKSARQWKHNLGQYSDIAKGLLEGFMDGNVEVLHLQDKLVVVTYHFSLPEQLPTSIPVGFISTNSETISNIGKLILQYIDGISSFDSPNDCGQITKILQN